MRAPRISRSRACGSETVLTRSFATSPAKLIATNGRGTTCWVYAATLGGGLVGGDEIRRARGRHRRCARAADDAGIDEGVSIAAPFAAEPAGDCGRRRAARGGAGSDRVFCERGLHADAAIRPARRCEPRHGGLDDIGPSCRRRALGVLALREPVRHQARLAADFLRRARARAEHRFCRRAHGPLRRAVDGSHYRTARCRGRDGHRELVCRRRQSIQSAPIS